ncbi:hypothetical protein evm_015307, partial [Chilo suppressalis]
MSGLGPPFDTAFYTVRVSVTSNLQEIVKTRRTLHLGLCLPYSCSRESVGALVGAAHAPLLRQAVVAVRSPQHGGYSYLHDPTFLVLLGVCSGMAVLLITATAYDMRLARAVRRQRQRAANLSSVDSSPRADLKLDLNGLDDIKVAN